MNHNAFTPNPGSQAGVITGWGSALPPNVVTNNDLKMYMDTTDEWILDRTGIRERRWVSSPEETVATLATEACQKALASAELKAKDIDLLILATCSPDQVLPGTSANVQELLGLECGAFDLGAACSGFVYSLVAAHGFLQMGMSRILVVGSEVLSRIIDPSDRGTGIIFGDGASAVVVEATTGPGHLLGWDLGVDGTARHSLYKNHHEFTFMDGKEVFRKAARAMVGSAQLALDRAGLTIDEIDWVVPHQANTRIITAANERLRFPMSRTSTSLERVGNTSGASIPHALGESLDAGDIVPGDHVLLCGFGAGMTWASAVLRWGGAERSGLHGRAAHPQQWSSVPESHAEA